MITKAISRKVSVFVRTAFLLLTLYTAEAQKQHRLVLLAFSQVTGAEPANGSMYRAAFQVAVNAVNNRTDILADYLVELEHRDEMNGFAAPQVVIKFGRRFENQSFLPQRTEYQAPIVVGNVITFGCASTGRFLHHVGMISISVGCLAPSMTNDRRDYPNVYRSRPSGELSVCPRVQFIKYVGNWREMAIITHTVNSMDYFIAKEMFRQAAANGIHIIWFNSVYDFTDEVMESLKKSDARIIAVEVNQAGTYLRYMCQSYKNGITGSRYIFTAPSNAFVDLRSLPDNIPGNPGCKRWMLAEQMKITHYVGLPLETVARQDDIRSLGYSVKGFEERFDALTNGVQDPDYPSRQAAHDAMAQALLTLEAADQLLKRQNLSLLSFADHPNVVMRAVNESAAKLQFKAIRVPVAKYSPRLERDFEPFAVGYWYANESSYQNFIVIQAANETLEAINECENYKIVNWLRQPPWITPDGRPPRDKWLLKITDKSISTTVFIVVLCGAIVLSITQLITGVRIFRKKNHENVGKILVRSKLLVTFGCCVVNAGAVSYSINVTSMILCVTRYSLLTVGMSLVNGYIFAKMALYAKRTKSTIKRATPRTMMTTRNNPIVMKPSVGLQYYNFLSIFESQPVKLLDGLMIAASAAFLLANAIGIAIWQNVTPYIYVVNKSRPVYFYDIDTYIISEERVCKLDDSASFTWLIIPAVHLLLLAVASVLAFKLRASQHAVKAPDFNVMRAAVANAAMLSASTIVVLLILNDNALIRQIVVSFAALIFSGSTSGILLIYSMKRSLDVSE